MEPASLVGIEYRVLHHHRDGTSAPMVEEREPHDPASLDPERRWPGRRLFRCTACDEAITIEPLGGDESDER
jgi:hypothetical protein